MCIQKIKNARLSLDGAIAGNGHLIGLELCAR